jgi:hypothetical protein
MAVRRYLDRAFGKRLPEVRVAMRRLAASFPPEDLDRWGLRLHDTFRPEDGPGWGKRGLLHLDRIAAGGPGRAAASGTGSSEHAPRC